MLKTLHDQAMLGWMNPQAALLRAGEQCKADIENVIEEIESRGCSEKSQLLSRLTILLRHLLKWQFQSYLQSNSWLFTMNEQRRRLTKLLRKNPSLRTLLLDENIAKAFKLAIVEAARETKLSKHIFPATCPYTPEQIVNTTFYPEFYPE